MEKLDLKTFRELKKEVADILGISHEVDERGKHISKEEEQQIIDRYDEIIKILSEHDLSDIDFEEWRGMFLIGYKDNPINFSKTRANLDFSVIEYDGDNKTNLKGCKIKNFNFEDNKYTPEMFDEEYIKENEEHFLSPETPKDVADRFYERKITLKDIKNNLEVANKVNERFLYYGLRDLYRRIGKEEFCKLDAEFIDETGSRPWMDLLDSMPQLHTAEEIMPVLYNSMRNQIIGLEEEKLFFVDRRKLGETFKEKNQDLFLNDDVPEKLKEYYYNNFLSLKMFSDNLQYFEGKNINISSFYEKKIVNLFGEDLYKMFVNYKPIMDKLIDDFITMAELEVPDGSLSEERKNEIFASALRTMVLRKGIESFSELKMIMDFLPLEQIPIEEKQKEFVRKYGVDKLLEYGIHDFTDLSKAVNDLHQIKELLKQRPTDLINMGQKSNLKLKFIEKYGIDNIIKLDEETNGMFSHKIWSDDIYLHMFANAEGMTSNLEIDKELTYDEFKNRMYEILLHSRDERGIMTSKDYPDYDFIQGKFREEHPDIFINGNIDPKTKAKFYTAHMEAEDVRQNPELIQLLQGKDLSRVFNKKMTVGISLSMVDKDGNTIGGIPNTVNMAQYLSEKLGQDEFLKICADYGKCLDYINLSSKSEISVESVRKTIEQEIYKGIKERGIEYFENLPSSFQKEHPELFLPKDIDENIRNKFYMGELSFEDIRNTPELKNILLTKDIDVVFLKTKYKPYGLGNGYWKGPNPYINPLWEKLSEREIIDFAEKYGKYLKDIDADIFVGNQSIEEKEKAIQENIEFNIFKRISPYDETIPDFFKRKHPEMFLSEEAPQELKQAFYDSKASTNKNFDMSFKLMKDHPEWKKFLNDKDLRRAFSKEYNELFNRFDVNTLIKLGSGNPETIEMMVQCHREDVLENWYKSTGGKFVPHHVVMLNFPEGEIDSFLENGKRWSQLMRIDNYNLNDDGKSAILKAAYSMGVFQGDDDGFNKTMQLFTDIPQELSHDEYEKVIQSIDNDINYIDFDTIAQEENVNEITNLFKQTYSLNNDGEYVLRIDKQKNKDTVRKIRKVLEKAEIPRILTPQKAHQMFGSFVMEYNPNFVKFFNENTEEILSNPDYIKDIATIQRQFKDIVRTNAGRRLTLDVARDYVKSIAYTDIDVGNEGVAEQAKIAGYSQKDFEAIQSLFNEGEVRDFSSIPRIQGETNGYTYEMLRCDDPLALTIGTLTDCCQEIHGPGQTSMEHSVVSPDGRVFVVKNEEGKVVAQSWFWRNQYVGCFDNIEIPKKIIAEYEKQHPDIGRKGLTDDVLKVYKKAAQELMQEDKKVYQELLENGDITQEQYDSLLLGRVTIGAGYNDIKNALREAHAKGEMGLDSTNEILPKKTDRLSYIYDDAHYENDGEHDGQYIISEREGIVKSEYENLYVHQDDVPVFDGTNMSSTVLLTMKRMEQETERDNLAYLSERSDETSLPKSQRIINSIAREYGFNPDSTKVMATARIAFIYSKDKDKIKIGDLLSSPIKTGLTEEQKQKAQSHIMYQVKKALKQMGVKDSEVDISSLSEEQQKMVQYVIKEIENDERGER